MDFDEIYTQYAPAVFRICMGYVNDTSRAADLVQETFISVWQNLSSFRGEAKISTWIYRIATNNCLQAIQREKRTPLLDLPSELPMPEHDSKEEQLQLLYRCIGELEELERIIIALELEEVPQSEIASITGLSHSNVRVKLHRAKEKLSKKFRAYGRF